MYEEKVDKELDSVINFNSLIDSEDITEKYPILDIDLFYTGLYNYYIERGYYSIICKSMSKIMFKIISIICFFISTLCIDWYVVLQHSNNQLFVLDFNNTNKVWLYYIMGTIIIISIQLIYNIMITIKYIFYMKTMRYFYNKIFYIDDNSLAFLKWSDIEYQLLNMKYNEKFPYIRKNIEPLSIVKRILRKQNYIILLLQSKYLQYHITDEIITYLNFIFLLFDDNCNLNKEYLKSKSLYYWLKILSGINLCLIPFKFIYTIVLFMLANMEFLYTNKDIVGNRHWDEKHFYLYNEYTHLLKHRLNKASYYMDLWMLKNPNTIFDTCLIFVISISSCILSILAPIIILNAQLSEYLIYNNPLIWYIAFFTSIILVSRKYLNKSNSINTNNLNHNKLKEKLLFYTCSDEPNIPERLNNLEYIDCGEIVNREISILQLVYKEYLQLYTYSIFNFIKNLLTIFTIPFILNRLANSHLAISDYIIKHTYSSNDGDMCIYSNFENVSYIQGINSKKTKDTLKKSLLLFINRNQSWYINYKNKIEFNGYKILPSLDELVLKKEEQKKEDLHGKEIDTKKEEFKLNYNIDEDKELLASDLFLQKDTSTIINGDIDNIV
jgi:hypothetical protein